MVAREEAPPPVATTLFRLTERGEQLRPLLRELLRWGLPLMLQENPADVVQSRWLAGALELLLTDRRPGEAPVTVQLETGDEPIVLQTDQGEIRARVGVAPDAIATLAGPPKPLVALLLGGLDRDTAERRGVSCAGDLGFLERVGAGAAIDPAPLLA